MKIAVIGAGAIGGLVAGYLKAKGQEVILVGHPDSVRAIKEKGLHISGVRGKLRLSLDISETLNFQPDLVILATKTQDIEAALADNLTYIRGAAVLTTQNGIQSEAIVSRYLAKENIISSIVMFGSTMLAAGEIVHNFEGSWIIGNMFGEINDRVIETSGLLNKIFPTVVAENIRGMKYLKIFVNANNCIPAILGESMQEAFCDVNISGISIAIWKEGLDIVEKCGINLVSLPDFPLERLTKLTLMPLAEAAKIYSGIMGSLSLEPLYGSILQSIKRGKTSEIDYINGEFVILAQKNKLAAPLNERLVEIVHEVERTGSFFSKEELLSAAKEFLN